MSGVVRGVILAAGASTRMGRPKATLPLTDRADSFLARLVRTFLAAGICDVVVVTGAHDAHVRAALSPADRRVRVVHNPEWPRGQLTSLHAALAPPARGRVDLVEAIVMTLVDIPLVSPATVATILNAWRTSRAPIVRPARGDEHGHPVIFDRVLFDTLRRADPEAGAKPVMRAHSDAILNVAVADEGAFLDVDTEAEYVALRQRLAWRSSSAISSARLTD